MRSTFTKAVFGALTMGSIIAFSGMAPAAPTELNSVLSASGFNDWNCRPTPERPTPLVLLHGLTSNGSTNYAYLGPYLANKGYCVFAPTYGAPAPNVPVGGTIPIEESAKEISAFVDHVLEVTKASKVSLIGHSEGGFQALYGPKMLGYAHKVQRIVALAPPTHGTNVLGLSQLEGLMDVRPVVDQVFNTFGCEACSQVLPGSTSVEDLTRGPIAQDGVDYTIIASRGDMLVMPHGKDETAFVREPGVHNMYVQDMCPQDSVGHLGLAFDSGVARMIANALDPEHPAPIPCTVGLPF